MSNLGLFAWGDGQPPPLREGGTTLVMTHHPLRRVLAFTGRSIHDVVNDPIAKNQVLGYYRVGAAGAQRCSELRGRSRGSGMLWGRVRCD